MRLTVINNGPKQGPALLTLPRDSQPPKSDERSPGAQGHSSNGPPQPVLLSHISIKPHSLHTHTHKLEEKYPVVYISQR